MYNTIVNNDASKGEFKVYGRAVDVRALDMRGRYGDALYQKMGWKPEYHLSSVDLCYLTPGYSAM